RLVAREVERALGPQRRREDRAGGVPGARRPGRRVGAGAPRARGEAPLRRVARLRAGARRQGGALRGGPPPRRLARGAARRAAPRRGQVREQRPRAPPRARAPAPRARRPARAAPQRPRRRAAGAASPRRLRGPDGPRGLGRRQGGVASEAPPRHPRRPGGRDDQGLRRGHVSGTPALDWLFGLQRFGMRPGLERVRALLAETGLPAPGTRVVLVAATNGKGTVTRLVASALTAAGRRTGSFFSPHLGRVGGRARVDGVGAAEEETEAAVAAVRPAAERLGCRFFEVVAAAALHRFRAAGAGWAVMEVGLGGRFDATNALEPVLSVVTGVSLDHQAVLGGTVAEIAREKAGVLRP